MRHGGDEYNPGHALALDAVRHDIGEYRLGDELECSGCEMEDGEKEEERGGDGKDVSCIR